MRARLVVTITSYQFLPDPPYPTPPKADPPAPPTPPKRTHYPLCDESEKQNEAVNVALGGLTVPLATLNEARTKRDAAIPDWEKHFRRLKEETGT